MKGAGAVPRGETTTQRDQLEEERGDRVADKRAPRGKIFPALSLI